ncbi:TetR/AcrR family transcriptional regulator [Acidithiobacillus montserratensis]|uniref:TetR/AcrR family transcriptional regulator n=1 Tax=Acidithiobacillus montserratensis TaxID=2729135 RepID=A0ACD5HFC1_9PROT|nr:TetR/AcrR family transcriptional regulator [Acidithiobacillus montserratensis]MBN2679667.1 TetR/AcrR family transcriptional regulator [Acidithiobacillaceae bacterium]MBU2747518.1 TetR/AcrR family transcriptional regulator [Acidithiobacillus montserratensis]
MDNIQAIAEGDGRQRILAAAEKLFSDKAFDAVSMSAIACEAGISKANIYHYFPNKDTLYLAVLRMASHNLRAVLNESVSAHGSVRDVLRHFAHNHLQALLKRPELVRLVWREILEKGAPRAQEFAEQGFADMFSALVDVLKLGQTRGEFRPDFDPALVATLLLGANVFFFQSRDILRHYPPITFADDPAGYDAGIVEILLRGLAPATA